MARPTVGEVAEDLFEALGPLTAFDEARDWPLLRFCAALTGGTLEQAHTYFADTDDGEGWVRLFDPLNTPAEALPYLAQFVGVKLEPKLTVAEQRAKVALPENFKRGTVAALRESVARTLTGTKTVLVVERYGDNAYALQVRTYAVETADDAATLAAVLAQKPGGIVLTYEAIIGQAWSDLESTSATWTAAAADYDDWTDVRSTLP